MKRQYLILNMALILALLTACSQTKSFTQEQSAPSILPLQANLQIRKNNLVPVLICDEISEKLYNDVPELKDIAAYIQMQSNHQAKMVIEAFEPINGHGANLHYPVYVGEEWDDSYRVNWFWFYVDEKTGEIDNYKSWIEDNEVLHGLNLIQDVLANDGYESLKLDDWIGVYFYAENEPSEQATRYILSIYKIADKCYADIELSQSEMSATLSAKIQGNENEIDLIFRDVKPWQKNYDNQLKQGDILLSLSKNEALLYTNWDTLKPSFGTDIQPNGIYFQLDNDIIRYQTQHIEHLTNSIESYGFDAPHALNAYHDFLNGKRMVVNQVTSDKVRLIDNIARFNSYVQYTLYDVTGDGIPELIIQGLYRYILTYDDGKLSVLHTDDGTADSLKFVNGGNLYNRHEGLASKLMHAYRELDNYGEVTRHFSVIFYHDNYDFDEGWVDSYVYYEDDIKRTLSEEEYNELVSIMANDDEIRWQDYYAPFHTRRFIGMPYFD